jgi:hypothetical protein
VPRIGYVKTTAPGALLRFGSEAREFRVELHGDKAPLPVGEHLAFNIQTCTWDEEGHRYRVQCLNPPENWGSVEIKEGETTVLEFGPPLVIETDPVREGEDIVVNVEVWGQYGERYFPYCLTDGGKLEWRKDIRIFDEKGTELDSGNFEWG